MSETEAPQDENTEAPRPRVPDYNFASLAGETPLLLRFSSREIEFAFDVSPTLQAQIARWASGLADADEGIATAQGVRLFARALHLTELEAQNEFGVMERTAFLTFLATGQLGVMAARKQPSAS